MEPTMAFRGSAASRSMAAIVAAVLVAFVLGVAGGYLIRTLSTPVAAPSARGASMHPPYSVGPGTRQPAEVGDLVTMHSTKHPTGTYGPTQGAQHAGH